MATTDTTKPTPTNEDLFDEYYKNTMEHVQKLNDEADEYTRIAQSPATQYPRVNHVERLLEEHRKTMPTQEEIKRENNKRKIAALGDGLVALSNMAGAVGGATPLQQQKTLTEAQKARFEEALKMRDGYKTRQERNAELSTVMQQQRAEDAYYNRLRMTEEAQKKQAGTEATKARSASNKLIGDLYKKATELGLKKEEVDSRIAKYKANIAQGNARTAAYVEKVHDDMKKSPDKSQGTTTTVTGNNKYGVKETKTSTTTYNANNNKTPKRNLTRGGRGKK